MNKFRYGNVKAKGIYLDENTLRMCDTHRTMFARLVEELLREGKYEKAQLALEKCEEELPGYNVPYGEYASALLVLDYLELEAQLKEHNDAKGAQQAADKAKVIYDYIGENLMQYYDYVSSLSDFHRSQIDKGDLARKASILEYMSYYAQRYGHEDWPNSYFAALDYFSEK